jgi:hypothetical protein
MSVCQVCEWACGRCLAWQSRRFEQCIIVGSRFVTCCLRPVWAALVAQTPAHHTFPGAGRCLARLFNSDIQIQTILESFRSSARMPRGVAKANLPSKMCVVCQRPFTWRKVWEKCWDEVQTCSDRCKSERKRLKQLANKGGKEPSAEQQQQQPASPADG